MPDATCAEYSPRLWPATKLGLGTRPSSTRSAAIGYGKNGRLGNFSEAQLVFRSIEADLRQFVAERFVGFFKGLARDGIFFDELFAHANSLRALAGKNERDFESRDSIFSGFGHDLGLREIQ